MKAQSLKKVPHAIENIYHEISEANANNHFKCLIPHFIYVTDEAKLQLIKDGYKVYEGNWDSLMKGLIIEW